MIGRLQILGANQRTLALGVAMLAGHPVWYFVYELSVLNVALLWSIRAHAAAALRLQAELVPETSGQLSAA